MDADEISITLWRAIIKALRDIPCIEEADIQILHTEQEYIVRLPPANRYTNNEREITVSVKISN